MRRARGRPESAMDAAMGIVPRRRGMSRWGDLFGKRHVASGAEAGTLASGATAGGTTGKKPNR